MQERALALVNPEGFPEPRIRQGGEVFTAEIVYPVDRENLLLAWETLQARNPGDFGFHYTPYNFDSRPEMNFFEQLLAELNLHPDDVVDLYFTGALTKPTQTDFYVRYRGEDGQWHAYTPDFLIRRKDGRCLIVEIKDARFELIVAQDLEREPRLVDALLHVEGRKAAALRRWTDLNADRLSYQILFARERSHRPRPDAARHAPSSPARRGRERRPIPREHQRPVGSLGQRRGGVRGVRAQPAPARPAVCRRSGPHALRRRPRPLGELAGLGRTMVNPHLLIGPFIRREAVLSSRIDGHAGRRR